MRVIVCGSAPRVNPERPGWTDRELMWRMLDELRDDVRANCPSDLVIIEGEAPGADQLARAWAEDRGVELLRFPADWSLGRRAGPARNRRMLHEGKAEVVVAFSLYWPVTGGTASMCTIADDAGVPVTVVTPDGERHGFDLRELAS